MKSTFSFLAGVLSGALVGAVAALLLAPMSGEQLQHDARQQFDHVMADARSAAEEKRAQLEAQLAALKKPRPAEPPAGEAAPAE
jgi:gas vesicle protein